MRTLLMLVLTVVVAVGTSAAQVVNQAGLAQTLSKGGDVFQVLEQIRSLDPKGLTVELRGALITRLEQINQRVAEVTRIDQTVDSVIAPETLADLSTVVAESRDPRSIAALSRATYGGAAVVRALAEFGEQALPEVLKVVLARSSDYTEVEHGLMTMRIMVERDKLSPAALAQIRAAAKARLTGDQYFTVVWQAIDLAGTLKDPELKGILKDLADDPNESHRRGITNQEAANIVEKTQKRAADRLAGIPARPDAKAVFAPRSLEP